MHTTQTIKAPMLYSLARHNWQVKIKPAKRNFILQVILSGLKVTNIIWMKKAKIPVKLRTEFVNANSSITFKKIGDYFYFYRGPAGKCAELKEIQDLQDQTSEAVKAFFQSLVAA
jgi:hypothetical protein